jgi:hypothetical protein
MDKLKEQVTPESVLRALDVYLDTWERVDGRLLDAKDQNFYTSNLTEDSDEEEDQANDSQSSEANDGARNPAFVVQRSDLSRLAINDFGRALRLIGQLSDPPPADSSPAAQADPQAVPVPSPAVGDKAPPTEQERRAGPRRASAGRRNRAV